MMRLKTMLFAGFLSVIVACNTGQPNDATVKAQFDNLEKVFETGNWKALKQNDTSYMFFSREGDALYKVYLYHIVNGDTAQSLASVIKTGKDSVVWDLDKDTLVLQGANANNNVWISKGARYALQFIKQDSLHISLNYSHPGTGRQNTFVLTRTLPISTFLVRSKYDFIHGTHTADATVDTVRKKR